MEICILVVLVLVVEVEVFVEVFVVDDVVAAAKDFVVVDVRVVFVTTVVAGVEATAFRVQKVTWLEGPL